MDEELRKQCRTIDAEAYDRAKMQAAKLDDLLQVSEAVVLTVDVGGVLVEFDIRHMDVANEWFTMLERLQKLGQHGAS